MGSRFTVIVFAVGVAYLGLLFHLYDVQLASGGYYLARAESQYGAGGFFEPARGVIYFTDKNGNRLPVATNKPFPLIYAVPKAIEDPLEAANRLSQALGVSVEELVRKFSKKNDTYELLGRKAGAETVGNIQAANVRGVYVDEVPERFYPFGTLAAHLLGFVGPNESDAGLSGHYGLEKFYEKTLAGILGEAKNGKIVPPRSGEDLMLTIDPSVQTEAERILGKLASDYRAAGGSVIVEDPRTGRILAMGSVPGFDPNEYGKAEVSRFLNPATERIYEPGSVFKVITMAAGIDAGKIAPDSTFFDTGSLTLNGKTIKNWDGKAHGRVTMTNVIEESLNTGAAFAERQTGDAIFSEYVKRFGFGEKTGVDLPGELAGDLRRLTPRSPAIAFATASFGQGVAATEIELINAFAAVANGGTLFRPYLNSSLAPQAVRQVVTSSTARQVTDMMISAVDKAKIAKIAGYAIAGKTGTAQVPDFKNGGYTDKVVNTYVGFGPAADPRFVVLVKLDEPEGAPLAGTTVVPAFRDLAQFVLNYYNIPPDRL